MKKLSLLIKGVNNLEIDNDAANEIVKYLGAHQHVTENSEENNLLLHEVYKLYVILNELHKADFSELKHKTSELKELIALTTFIISPIAALSEELLYEILSYLDVKTMLTCSLVCKAFSRLVYDPQFEFQKKLPRDYTRFISDEGKKIASDVICYLDIGKGKVAVGHRSGIISIIDLESMGCVKVLSEHTRSVSCLEKYSENELLSVDNRGVFKIWDLETGQSTKTTAQTDFKLKSLCYWKEGFWLCLKRDKTLVFFDPILENTQLSDFSSIKFLKYLSKDCIVFADSQQIYFSYKKRRNNVICCNIDITEPKVLTATMIDNERLALGIEDHRIEIYSTGRMFEPFNEYFGDFKVHTDLITDITGLPNGWIASASKDKNVVISFPKHHCKLITLRDVDARSLACVTTKNGVHLLLHHNNNELSKWSFAPRKRTLHYIAEDEGIIPYPCEEKKTQTSTERFADEVPQTSLSHCLRFFDTKRTVILMGATASITAGTFCATSFFSTSQIAVNICASLGMFAAFMPHAAMLLFVFSCVLTAVAAKTFYEDKEATTMGSRDDLIITHNYN